MSIGLWLIIIGGIVAVYGFIGWVPDFSRLESEPQGTKQRKISKRQIKAMRQSEIEDFVNRVARLRERVDSLVLKRGKVEMDPAFCIDNPSFTDPRQDFVINLNRAQTAAVRGVESLEAKSSEHLTKDYIDDNVSKVNDFEVALTTAIDTATAIGWGRVSAEEKKLYNRAKSYLEIITNEVASDTDKNNALKGLSGIIGTLKEKYGRVINEEKMKIAIETKTQLKMLTTGDDGYDSEIRHNAEKEAEEIASSGNIFNKAGER